MERTRLPTTRASITHKAEVGGCEFYTTVGIYADGDPGELFITVGKEGSTVAGLLDAFGIAISMLLQSGWTVKDLAKKFTGATFEPRGVTNNPELAQVSSIIDYIFKWMVLQFPDRPPKAPEAHKP